MIDPKALDAAFGKVLADVAALLNPPYSSNSFREGCVRQKAL
jgi:hypothetical protein